MRMLIAGDKDFVALHMSTLEKEYQFWMTDRVVKINNYTLNRYASLVNQPRPESYREDQELIRGLLSGDRRKACLRSVCKDK